MQNLIQDGHTMTYTVPVDASAPVKSGDLVVVGAVVGVAVTDGLPGETIALAVEGVYELPKGSGALAQGAKAYANVTDGVLTIVGTASGNTLAGYVWADAVAADTVVNVRIN